jgi:putative membrane protein
LEPAGDALTVKWLPGNSSWIFAVSQTTKKFGQLERDNGSPCKQDDDSRPLNTEGESPPMKQTIFRMTTIAAAVVLTGALAFAQQQPMGDTPPGTPSQQTPNAGNAGMNGMQQMQQENSMQVMQDHEFVRAALQGGMAEVELGQLAEQKGASADVRQFGQKMVNDHTQLNNLMKQVAAKTQTREPKGISKKDKKLYARLSTLSGKQFDDAYIKVMLKDHKDDLDSFRREATDSQNPAIQQAASEGAQMISGHLQLIKSIARNDGVKS